MLQDLLPNAQVKIMLVGEHRSTPINVLFLKFAGPFVPDFRIVCMALSLLLGDRTSCDKCSLMTQHVCQMLQSVFLNQLHPFNEDF